jgi:hypothetical protein
MIECEKQIKINDMSTNVRREIVSLFFYAQKDSVSKK